VYEYEQCLLIYSYVCNIFAHLRFAFEYIVKYTGARQAAPKVLVDIYRFAYHPHPLAVGLVTRDARGSTGHLGSNRCCHVQEEEEAGTGLARVSASPGTHRLARRAVDRIPTGPRSGTASLWLTAGVPYRRFS